MKDSQQVPESLLQSEASVRLEGIDPLSSPRYMALRARVIAGEITSAQAVDLLIASVVDSKNAAA